jgi:hypothetical protein
MGSRKLSATNFSTAHGTQSEQPQYIAYLEKTLEKADQAIAGVKQLEYRLNQLSSNDELHLKVKDV